MSQWRITEGNPVREVQGLDYERCAALHNLIVERGWVQSGRHRDNLDRRTWWECLGGDAALQEHAERLDASVIDFLKTAWHGFSTESVHPSHNFHRYLAQLCSPEYLWENAIYGEDEDESNKRRYITLYMANWALGASHPLGLVFDQDNFTAIQHISTSDSMITMNGRQMWLPLELILEGFLEMMDQGKAVAVSEDYDGEQERTGSWIMPSYTEQDLHNALEAFEQLVQAIEARMPQPPTQGVEHGLFNVNDPNTSSAFPDGFARRFLTHARRPRNFTHIAPGLRVATKQPFATVPVEAGKLRPLLLFEAPGHRAHQDTTRAPWGQDVPISPFHRDFASVMTYPAGVYFTEVDPHGAHPFEDGCKLLLPFGIGSNRFAMKSDGSLIGEDVADHSSPESVNNAPRSGELFQLGFNHFIEMHDVQLHRMLRKWAELVEEGKWEVNLDGVAGGIEKWREADTEEHCEDYLLPMTW